MAAQREARLGQVPHFTVATLDGRHVRYDEIWQRRNLVLVAAGPQRRDAAARYASELDARRAAFDEAETSVVVTADDVRGLRTPAVVVADRWGEILHMQMLGDEQAASPPDVEELLSWVRFAEIQCPECPP